MVKKSLLLIIAFLGIHSTYGQVIRLQGGPSVSNLEWSVENIRRLGPDEIFIGKSAFIGLDYLNSRYFNLSTNIGYLQKGDRSDIAYINDEEVMVFRGLEAVFDFFSLNTLAEFKLPIKQQFIPYISLGPRIEYLQAYTKDFSFIEQMDELPNYAYGFNLGAGFRLDFRRLQVGIRTDYYLKTAKMAEWDSDGEEKEWIDDTTFLVNLTIGYKLR